jgi:hypothetical protein
MATQSQPNQRLGAFPQGGRYQPLLAQRLLAFIVSSRARTEAHCLNEMHKARSAFLALISKLPTISPKRLTIERMKTSRQLIANMMLRPESRRSCRFRLARSIPAKNSSDTNHAVEGGGATRPPNAAPVFEVALPIIGAVNKNGRGPAPPRFDLGSRCLVAGDPTKAGFRYVNFSKAKFLCSSAIVFADLMCIRIFEG